MTKKLTKENEFNMKNMISAGGVRFGTYLVFLMGFVIRLIYIFNTTVYERSHDVGAYTSLTDGQINPGHLGYIEYIVKFGKLPQINPFDLFSYYHPPLHHILGALTVKLSLLFGASYEMAFENVQIYTALVSMLCLFIAYKILRLFSKDNVYTLLAMILMTFHPAMIYMSGYVNNDMLTLLFELLCIYFTLRYVEIIKEDKVFYEKAASADTDNGNIKGTIKKAKSKYLIFMALSIGLGMCVKISVVLFAIPMGIVMLYELINVNKNELIALIRQYIIFGIISVSIGMSWTLRNLIKFHQKPGIASATPEDIKYMGNWSLLQRIGIPFNVEFKYPFFNEYGSVSSNIWDIMFKTSLFGEMRPDISDFMLIICRVGLIISIFGFIILTLVSLIRYIGIIKNGDKILGTFLLAGFIAVLLSYVAFTIKYPYTCSCDFRYIIVILMYFAITVSLPQKQAPKK